MARDWVDYVTGHVETPFGPMEFAMTSGTHVSISAGGSSDKKADAIVVNGVPYYTHLHLHLLSDGTWGAKDYHALHMSKLGMGKDASDAARRKAIEGISSAWMAFMEEHPELIPEAELGAISRAIGSAEGDIEKKQAELDELLAKRNELLAREAELQP